jgi:2-iminobutanoate/2-iminopropanoate deaminase
MKKQINTKNAPAPIGPYSQAIRVDNTLYVSGQIAINPTTGDLEIDDLKKEIRLVMENIIAILKEADLSIEHIVKSSIFLKDMGDFPIVNEVYGTYFENCTPPARETVQVSMLPKDVNVEISVIACKVR